MRSFRASFLPLATFVLAGVAGCGGGGDLVPVSGTLTYKGKPVTNAYVDFFPEPGRPSWGQTDEQGRFTLHYDKDHDGAVAGKHRVAVRRRLVTLDEQEAYMKGQKPPSSKELDEFFEKYSTENSKIEIIIEKSAKNLKLDWD